MTIDGVRCRADPTNECRRGRSKVGGSIGGEVPANGLEKKKSLYSGRKVVTSIGLCVKTSDITRGIILLTGFSLRIDRLIGAHNELNGGFEHFQLGLVGEEGSSEAAIFVALNHQLEVGGIVMFQAQMIRNLKRNPNSITLHEKLGCSGNKGVCEY